MARILVVDDEPDLRETVRKVLARDGHEVGLAGSGAEALERMAEGFDAVLTDLVMPGVDGLGVVAAARERAQGVPVVVLTAHASVETAVDAMRAGAWDYVAKPFTPAQLRAVVTRALQHACLAAENVRLRAELRARSGAGFLALSPAMQAVEATVDRVGPTDLTVLITGESGTGKEVVARALHAASARASRAFVPVDCAAIPAPLVESELFGHEKGSFTGAASARAGLVEEADGGTFFLDEIGDLDPGVQVKLLRLLQEHEFRRVGSNRLQRASLRVLAATHRDLEALVAEGKFREDLYHRLNVVRIRLPPLRERREEIVPLVEALIERFRHESGRAALKLSPEVCAALLAHRWPGNVRELANVARFLVGLARGPEANLGDLPPSTRGAEAGIAAGEGLAAATAARFDLPYKEAKRLWTDAFDEAYIRKLLDAHGGNVSAAARTAGIDRKSIQRILARDRSDDPSDGDS